jgi:hypothetical protein
MGRGDGWCAEAAGEVVEEWEMREGQIDRRELDGVECGWGFGEVGCVVVRGAEGEGGGECFCEGGSVPAWVACLVVLFQVGA